MPKKKAPKHRLSTTYQVSSEDRGWLEMAPIGREFGSPDYERLTELDHAAFTVFQSWEQARDWLSAPSSQLDGACPDDAARSPDGFSKVMSMLMVNGARVGDDFMREMESLPVQERNTFKGLL